MDITPVPFTCPDIDKILLHLNNVSKILDDAYFNFQSLNSEDVYDAISDARYNLDGLDSMLEKIRSANAQLRHNAEYLEELIKTK